MLQLLLLLKQPPSQVLLVLQLLPLLKQSPSQPSCWQQAFEKKLKKRVKRKTLNSYEPNGHVNMRFAALRACWLSGGPLCMLWNTHAAADFRSARMFTQRGAALMWNKHAADLRSARMLTQRGTALMWNKHAADLRSARMLTQRGTALL